MLGGPVRLDRGFCRPAGHRLAQQRLGQRALAGKEVIDAAGRGTAQAPDIADRRCHIAALDERGEGRFEDMLTAVGSAHADSSRRN
jgi:hypothetical protein